MYKAATILDTSPYVVRYLAQKHSWKRPADKAPAILAGVKAGNMPATFYKTLDFSNVETNTTSKKENTNEPK